jgi:hypothetical protein
MKKCCCCGQDLNDEHATECWECHTSLSGETRPSGTPFFLQTVDGVPLHRPLQTRGQCMLGTLLITCLGATLASYAWVGLDAHLVGRGADLVSFLAANSAVMPACLLSFLLGVFCWHHEW